MASWHLSSNKILFFSCTIFITIVVGFHLLPYIPSVVSPSNVIISAPTSLHHRQYSCLFSLHRIMYTDTKKCSNKHDHQTGCNKKQYWEWIESGRVAECEFRRLKKSYASNLLNGLWVVIAGDSQARLMAISFLDLIMGRESMERIRGALYKGDYSIRVEEIGMKFDFVWSPFVRNLSELIVGFRLNKHLPDVILMGAGLWDMLHINNVSEYGASLNVLRDNTLQLSSKSRKLLHLFWIGMPKLITKMLNTKKKRERMIPIIYNSYDNQLTRSKLLGQSGGPFFKLDICLLSGLCGIHCTSDGMHYNGVVYDQAIQIMLNALLIQSNQQFV